VKISMCHQILDLAVGVRGIAITLGSRVVVALLLSDRLLSFRGAGYRFRP
jgi:hypothetical protein